jgi:hypothetical protein
MGSSQRNAEMPNVDGFVFDDGGLANPGTIRCFWLYPYLFIEDRVMQSGSSLFALCAIDETPEQARPVRCSRSLIERELCRCMGATK